MELAAKSHRRSCAPRSARNPWNVLPCARAAARSWPDSRTSRRIATPTTSDGIQITATATGQPYETMSHAPTRGTATVPRLPPAMCAAIAPACSRTGRCSAIKALSTGCCGEPPIRATIVKSENGSQLVAVARAVMPAP
jgi:hypothetical protein